MTIDHDDGIKNDDDDEDNEMKTIMTAMAMMGMMIYSPGNEHIGYLSALMSR